MEVTPVFPPENVTVCVQVCILKMLCVHASSGIYTENECLSAGLYTDSFVCACAQARFTKGVCVCVWALLCTLTMRVIPGLYTECRVCQRISDFWG